MIELGNDVLVPTRDGHKLTAHKVGRDADVRTVLDRALDRLRRYGPVKVDSAEIVRRSRMENTGE